MAGDSLGHVMTGHSILVALAVVLGLALSEEPARATDYSALKCGAASLSAAEKAICGNYGLGQLEARMATLYQWSTAFVGMGQRGEMQDAQRGFLKQRDACGADLGCLRRIYEARIGQLQTVMERVGARGPF
jgi:uncharacterized protein